MFLNIKSMKLFIVLSFFVSVFLVIYYIYISNYNKHIQKLNDRKISQLLMRQQLPHNTKQLAQQFLKSQMLEEQRLEQLREQEFIANINSPIIPEKYDEKVVKNRIMYEKVKQLSTNNDQVPVLKKKENDFFTMDRDLLIHNKTVDNVQIFYYMPVKWYKDNLSSVVNTAFFPKKFFYNFTNNIFKKHLEDIHSCGIGVIVLNFRPDLKDMTDIFPNIFELARTQTNVKISIQIEDYEDRTIESIRNDIKFFIDNFNSGLHKLYSIKYSRLLPVFYIKNSFLIKESDWKKLTTKGGLLTIKNTYYDALLIGHIETSDHKAFIRKASLDGLYTQSVSNGATYASSWKNWVVLKKFADYYKLIFVPTVGPGFYDITKQPKHGSIRRFRSNGQYYEVAFRTALTINSQFVTIESYNNWADGTQIEEAVPAVGFKDYLPQSPIKYLEISQHWVNQFYKLKLDNLKHNSQTCENFLNNTIC